MYIVELPSNTCSQFAHINARQDSVYHQRQKEADSKYWHFGPSAPQRRYFYAVSDKTSAQDANTTVYALQMACIPHSYIAAVNETVTSGQNNDLVVFSTLSAFKGASNATGVLTDRIEDGLESRREYMLPQYPADVSKGEQLVIDKSTSPLYKTPYFGGMFYTVDLVSWIGSSGGAIIDIEKSRVARRPVIAGVLMSEGWQMCDSGLVPVSTETHIVQSLAQVQPQRVVANGEQVSAPAPTDSGKAPPQTVQPDNATPLEPDFSQKDSQGDDNAQPHSSNESEDDSIAADPTPVAN